MPLSRRTFIKTSAIGLSAIPFAGSLAFDLADDQDDLYSLSEQLTRQWAKALIALQVTDKADVNNYGGIFCPADKIVHGRCADAIYPFFRLAEQTKDSRYIDSAMLLYHWMENRVSQPDGSWLNEPVKGAWKGITVFTTIGLAEMLKNHGELAGTKFKNEVIERLRKAGDFIYNNFSINYGNINYPISGSYALSLLGTLLDIPKFKTKGRELAHNALPFITPKDGFISGEGGPYDKPSPKGCFSVDLGYNVEESLPSLVLYSKLTNDDEVLTAVIRSLKTHLEFMLPDGGWDNSWGTRNFKWTYWGSRTSDGCQAAYTLLADHDPRFYKAALKNTQLLQQCTKDGLLYGGPHYVSHQVPACVHHTFCHIKALTTILDHQHIKPKTPVRTITLPREAAYGARFFNDIQTWLIAKGKYRATITGYDREYKDKNGHATGGAITMLWHEKTGPILAASMNEYQLIEVNNMQPDTDLLSMPLTPRIELKTDNSLYMNISDLAAKIEVENTSDTIRVKTWSKLVNRDQQSPSSGEIKCRVDYIFSDKKVTIQFQYDKTVHSDVKIILPIISKSTEEVKLNGNSAEIDKGSAMLKINANCKLELLPTTKKRAFNFVPGLEAIPFGIKQNDAIITIEVV